MVDIVVFRDLGDRQGDDIVDPLVTEIFVGLSRGRAELDQRASNKSDIRYQTVYRSNVRLGDLIEISDALQGLTYRAKVVGINHEISPTGAITNLVIEREVDF